MKISPVKLSALDAVFPVSFGTRVDRTKRIADLLLQATLKDARVKGEFSDAAFAFEQKARKLLKHENKNGFRWSVKGIDTEKGRYIAVNDKWNKKTAVFKGKDLRFYIEVSNEPPITDESGRYLTHDRMLEFSDGKPVRYREDIIRDKKGIGIGAGFEITYNDANMLKVIKNVKYTEAGSISTTGERLNFNSEGRFLP